MGRSQTQNDKVCSVLESRAHRNVGGSGWVDLSTNTCMMYVFIPFGLRSHFFSSSF